MLDAKLPLLVPAKTCNTSTGTSRFPKSMARFAYGCKRHVGATAFNITRGTTLLMLAWLLPEALSDYMMTK
jgi:hypothetical protein